MNHRTQVLATLTLVAAVLGAVTQIGPPTTQAAGTRYVDMVFDATTVDADLVYATAPALVTGTPEQLKLDVISPKGDTLTNRPAIVTIHGGGFKSGSKEAFTATSIPWARRGYVVIPINYRLDAGNRCQDVQDGQIPLADLAVETLRCQTAVEAARDDSFAAIRWLRAHAAQYGIDPTRIAVMGGSAGAVTALNLAYQSDTPGDIGAYDGYDSSVGAALAMSGCNYRPETIGPGDAPVSLIHAELDAAVPFQCALDTATLARSKGLVAETMLWYGESTHAQSLYKKYQSTIDPVWADFLIRQLNLRKVVQPNARVEIHGAPNRSAIVSLVATQTGSGGYLQALPCAAAAGSTSNLNIDAAGQTRSGLAVVQFDATGTACVFSSMSAHVIVDLQGYLTDGAFDDLADARLLDTRGGSQPRANATVVVHGEPNRSAVLSLIATGSQGWGYVQAIPCGSSPGATSNINVDIAGQTRAGLAIVAFGADGTACIHTSVATHLIVDLQGYFASGSFYDSPDSRLLDTRGGNRVAANSLTVIHGVALSSAFISIIATDTFGGGYLTALPCSATPGLTSNLNMDGAGMTIAGAAVVQFAADGTACIFSSIGTHLVVDLQGYFSPGAFDDTSDARLLDTRQGS